MPNRNVILIARTMRENDTPTRYIFHWAELIKKEAELLDLKVIDLQNEDFDEERMKKLIEEHDPFLIFLNGHGTRYSVRGYDGETDVIFACKNDHLFKDRIVYVLSCHTARILGKSAYTKGCQCYIGYTTKVIFPAQGLDDVLSDFVSEPFMKASNEIVLALMKGGSPEEAIQKFHRLIENLINYWEKQDKPEAPTIVMYLKLFKKIQFAYLR